MPHMMEITANLLDIPIARLGASTLTLGQAALAGFCLLAILLAAVLVAVWRNGRKQATALAERHDVAREAEIRMAEIAKAQSEMQGRIGAMAEVFGTRQEELTRALGERLDGMSSRIGHSISEQTRATHENLSRLQERLATIDTAQSNIQSLAGQVVQLQHILSNKQTRGAFGQSRMEAIVADGLPHGAYEFQATLSNGNRPDCVVRMPNGAPDLVIDAKFPLEAWNAIRTASEKGEDSSRPAQFFRRDVEVHIRAIAEKYLIQGETQDTAFMFVPSESVFAEIHENFEGLVQKAHKARIVIVSPSLLMLSIQVITALLKDARMREQAHLIQGEVVSLMEDLTRLEDRVQKLQDHFQLANKDIGLILTSADKLARRGRKIEALEFSEEARLAEETPPAKPASAASSTGQLRLRVVDDE